jgi:hypothetical protein
MAIRFGRYAAAVLATVLLAAGGGCRDDSAADDPDDVVRMNHIQVVGTHNSYHRRLPQAAFDALQAFSAPVAASVDYDHPPLDEQLDAGIRQLELDVFADPAGGLFATRAANPLIGLPKETGIAELERPGFKVLHRVEIDFESTCLTLVACLTAIEEWSDAHPRHLPVMVLIESKESPEPDPLGLGFVTPVPVRGAELDALEAEIRSVFAAEDLITPDVVRGDRASLREAVTDDGWPSLARSRGKVLFALDNDGAIRKAYTHGHPALKGRVMFTFSGVDAPESALVSRPNPIEQSAEIRALVRRGFMVRTRADAETKEARSGDTRRRDAALASGAHWVSTDYPVEDVRFGTAYRVQLPGASVARCNPVFAPEECRDATFE